MNILRIANSKNASKILKCPRCDASLPLRAVFCSFCGERIKDQQDKRQVSYSKNEQDELQEKLPQVPEPEVSTFLAKDSTTPSSSECSIDEIKFTTTPFPSQQRGTLYLPSSNWVWPVLIILSVSAASLVNFVFVDISIRPFIMLWFLFICPGMALVPFLRLKEPAAEWVLAIVLSLAIDASVAMLQLYTGLWSPEGTLSILVSISVIATIVQLIMKRYCGY